MLVRRIEHPVAVELQLLSDLLFYLLHGKMNGIQYQIHCLFRSGFVSHNAIVIEIADHGQIQYTLLGANVGDVRDPFAVGSVRMELPVQQILVLVCLLAHLNPLPVPPYFGQ